MQRAARLAMVPMLLVCSVAASGATTPTSALDVPAATRFANLALKCLHSEYPNHISHTLDSDAAAQPPHVLTPAFYGCLDWHSDVHGHWLLVRLLRLFPDAPFAPTARGMRQPWRHLWQRPSSLDESASDR